MGNAEFSGVSVDLELRVSQSKRRGFVVEPHGPKSTNQTRDVGGMSMYMSKTKELSKNLCLILVSKKSWILAMRACLSSL